jgi:hypothetical protein
MVLSGKQRIAAQSSCEAEYVAAAAAACQGVWLARLIGELIGEDDVKHTIRIDNQSAISLSKNPVFHERSKHIDVRYHFIRNCVETGQVEVEHVRTENQHADILTKPLSRFRFEELKEKISMHLVSSGLQA